MFDDGGWSSNEMHGLGMATMHGADRGLVCGERRGGERAWHSVGRTEVGRYSGRGFAGVWRDGDYVSGGLATGRDERGALMGGGADALVGGLVGEGPWLRRRSRLVSSRQDSSGV